MRKVLLGISFLLCLFIFRFCTSPDAKRRLAIAAEMETHMKTGILAKWYPLAVDTIFGGFLSTFTYDFKPSGDQDKMIVTQARHTWSNSKAADLYPNEKQFLSNASHGFRFLKDVMWDKKFGGFYQLVDRQGNVKNGDSTKTAYGNTFAIFALAAYYKAS